MTTRPTKRGWIAIAALVTPMAACRGEIADARPQWTVVVATDAPVPQFGDRLVVELLDEQGAPCSGCRRIFDVSHGDKWPLSFGVLPSELGGTPRMRVRLYRTADAGSDGTPGSVAGIDALARLPALGAGITRVAVELRMDCFGVAADVAAHTTCDPTGGAALPEPTLTAYAGTLDALVREGSWPRAQPVDCNGAPPAKMICIPGGAFILGFPHDFPSDIATLPTPEHVVQLGAFAIDEDEITVGQMRSLVNAKGLDEPIAHTSDPMSSTFMCSYLTKDDATNDAMALNCVPFALAERVCAALGKRLPTESEWEFVAGNAQRESSYPWGEDDDICAHAISAVGRTDIMFLEPTTCRTIGGKTGAPGPVAGGSARDATSLGVRNMGGNMAEWVADVFSPYTSACWNSARLLSNPMCSQPSMGIHSVRGSCWSCAARQARAFERLHDTTDGPSDQVGFRCAKSM